MEFGLALVIFFSHAGENYSVGNIEVGNTKIVADYISELTGADQFEIVAVKDYDMPYNDLIKVAKEEANNGKTIIPFVTHEGSGLASTVSDIKKAWPNATVKDGFAIYGHEVRSGKAKVEKWINGLK